jgi:hypothetical protein
MDESLTELLPLIRVLRDPKNAIERNRLEDQVSLAVPEFEIVAAQTLHPPSTTTTNGMWTYKSKYEAGIAEADECVDAEDKGTRKGTLWHSLCGLQHDVGEFGSGVLFVAEGTQAQNELLARFAWWISTCLYAFGWGLGLLGKLYGVPEAAGGAGAPLFSSGGWPNFSFRRHHNN